MLKFFVRIGFAAIVAVTGFEGGYTFDQTNRQRERSIAFDRGYKKAQDTNLLNVIVWSRPRLFNIECQTAIWAYRDGRRPEHLRQEWYKTPTEWAIWLRGLRSGLNDPSILPTWGCKKR